MSLPEVFLPAEVFLQLMCTTNDHQTQDQLIICHPIRLLQSCNRPSAMEAVKQYNNNNNNSTQLIPEVPNLIITFVLMLGIIYLGFIDWWCGWSMFCTSEYKNIPCTHNRYKFHSCLALYNFTHVILEVPNLISTFVLMSVLKILSGVNIYSTLIGTVHIL